MRSLTISAGGLALLSVGCAAPATVPASDVGNAIVIEDASISTSRGSLVSILRDHVRGMSVSRTDVCPHIVLRGEIGRSQVAEVLVYVDGQRMSDTCILDGLNTESIARIEVYPGGFTQRPGYTSNSGGLILVFTKGGSPVA
jgi:hypothetical protein